MANLAGMTGGERVPYRPMDAPGWAWQGAPTPQAAWQDVAGLVQQGTQAVGFQPVQEGQSFWDNVNPFQREVSLFGTPNAAPDPAAKEAVIQKILAGLAGPEVAQGPAPSYTTTYDLGQATPPLELLMPQMAGVAPPPDYSSLMQYLPKPQRFEQQVAPAPDYAAADAAMQAAKPGEVAQAPLWSSVLQGLAAGGMRGIDGNVGEFLLSAALGSLSGLGSGQEQQAAIQRQADREARQYQEGLAGYEGEKANTLRAVEQQQSDAKFAADTNYFDQLGDYGRTEMQLAGRGLDAQQQYNQSLMNAQVQAAENRRQALLSIWQADQPSIRSAGAGGILLEKTNPETGHRELVWDRTSVAELATLKALKGHAAGAGFQDTSTDPMDGMNNVALMFTQNPQLGPGLFGEDMWGQMLQQMSNATSAVAGDGSSKDAMQYRQQALFNMIRSNLIDYMNENPEGMMKFLEDNGFIDG